MILHPLSAVTVALAASLSPQDVQVTPDVGPIHRAADGAVPDGDPDRIRISGQRLGEDAVKEPRIETMEAVLARAAEWVQPAENPRMRNGRQGEWRVPSRKDRSCPASGTKCLINRWGDTSMGIGLGRERDVAQVMIARHGGAGIEAEAVRVLGFREGALVAETPWSEALGDAPRALRIDFQDVDRVVFEARPSPTGAGYFAIDDLVLEGARGLLETLDFEDLAWGERPAATGHRGLTWEEGTGSFEPPAPRVVPAPREPLQPGLAPPGSEDVSRNVGGGGTAPTLLRDFRGPRLGDPGAGFIPPDTCGAPGIDHFCAIVNQNLSIYEKATENRVLSVSLQTFWAASGSVGDPRIAYDFANDRWCAIATDFGELLYFAYSLTSDPTGAWFKASLDLVDGFDAGRWIDYPTLGVDSRGAFIEAYMVGSPARMSIFAIDTAPLRTSTPAVGTVTAFRNLTWDGAIQHASQVDDAGTSWMISTGSSTTLRLRRIDPPMTAPTLTSFSVSVPGYGTPPDAPALGSTVDINTGGTRLMNAAYAGGSIWAAHCVARGGRAAARWYEVEPTTQTLLQSGNVEDPSLHFYFPSIAADTNGNVVMGFSGSDAQTFPSCYFTGRIAGDLPGEMAPAELYSEGLASYTLTDGAGRNRWGDYSLTSLDPVDGSFWTIQERTRSQSNSWVTQIAQLEHSDCGQVETICTSFPTPGGSFPAMTWSGSTSVGANDFALLATGVPPGQFGLFFYGRDRDFLLLGDGLLCIDQPLYRITPVVQVSPFGVASLPLDLTSPPDPSGTIAAGETWNFSFWFRQASPGGFNFAGGLGVTFCE